mmetsp:Transcript_22160/g.44457  ORF Transcript_22160/g.44457 Transcript_22160/m.44457 type:complete len:224 (-) Transcript_22160:33-704(-)
MDIIRYQVGDRPHMFVDIPPSLLNEFHTVFANTVGRGTELGFMSECASLPVFPLFYDVDNPGVERKRMKTPLALAQTLHHTLKSIYPHKFLRIVCCGENPDPHVPQNLHLHVPDLNVTIPKALQIRRAFIRDLSSSSDTNDVNWNKCVDEGILLTHKTLRMPFSHKSTKGVHVGRPYQLVCALDCEGVQDKVAERAYLKNPVMLLKDASIRTNDQVETAPQRS